MKIYHFSVSGHSEVHKLEILIWTKRWTLLFCEAIWTAQDFLDMSLLLREERCFWLLSPANFSYWLQLETLGEEEPTGNESEV